MSVQTPKGSSGSDKENSPRSTTEFIPKTECPWYRRGRYSNSVKASRRQLTMSTDTSQDSLDSWNVGSFSEFQDRNTSTPNLFIDKRSKIHDLMTSGNRRRKISRESSCSSTSVLVKRRGASSSSLKELINSVFHRSASVNFADQDYSYMEDSIVQHRNDVEQVTVDAFRDVQLEDGALYRMHENIKELQNTMTNTNIYDHFKNDLLPKGMRELEAQIGQPDSSPYCWDHWLFQVADVWRRFYQVTVPLIQCFFYTIHPPRLTIRQSCLAAFRDDIVLKIPIQQAIQSTQQKIPKDIRHMFLIMQGIHDTDPPNLQTLEMEKLTTKVVRPYLGYRGIYIKGENSDEPTIPSKKLELDRENMEATSAHLQRLWTGPVGRKPICTINSFSDLVKKATQ